MGPVILSIYEWTLYYPILQYQTGENGFIQLNWNIYDN